MRGRTFAALVAVLLFAGVPAASADPPQEPTPPAPMTGETFTGGPENVSVTGDCSTGTVNFQVSGAVALGPYPGFALENGTLKLSPLPAPGIPGAFIVDEFHATFKVSQERPINDFVVEIVDVVEGRKDYVRQPTDTGFAFAFCDRRGPGFKIGFDESTVQAHYEARIRTEEGIFHDEGTTTLQARDCRFNFSFGACAGPDDDGLESFFQETFVSTLEETVPIVTPPGNSPAVQNGKGCGDENHLHEKEALCK